MWSFMLLSVIFSIILHLTFFPLSIIYFQDQDKDNQLLFLYYSSLNLFP